MTGLSSALRRAAGGVSSREFFVPKQDRTGYSIERWMRCPVTGAVPSRSHPMWAGRPIRTEVRMSMVTTVPLARERQRRTSEGSVDGYARVHPLRIKARASASGSSIVPSGSKVLIGPLPIELIGSACGLADSHGARQRDNTPRFPGASGIKVDHSLRRGRAPLGLLDPVQSLRGRNRPDRRTCPWENSRSRENTQSANGPREGRRRTRLRSARFARARASLCRIPACKE